jgi:hypothetical protein
MKLKTEKINKMWLDDFKSFVLVQDEVENKENGSYYVAVSIPTLTLSSERFLTEDEYRTIYSKIYIDFRKYIDDLPKIGIDPNKVEKY